MVAEIDPGEEVNTFGKLLDEVIKHLRMANVTADDRFPRAITARRRARCHVNSKGLRVRLF